VLTAFCQRLGLRLIHSTVYHPQTNGKLERAFRDDMQEFYHQHEKWLFNDLRRALPAYVTYRNQIRGHYALQGHPAVTRLREQHYFALPTVLDRLEQYAWCDRGHKKVGANRCLGAQGRRVYINPKLSGQHLGLYETLDGLEAEDADGKYYLLRNYRTEFCQPSWKVKDPTRLYYFKRRYYSRRAEVSIMRPLTNVAGKSIETCKSAAQSCPRIAVAYSQ
jgi:Integrase core domain